MSVHPHHEQFRANAFEINGDPALVEKFGLSDYAKDLHKYLRQNRAELHGVVMETGQRNEGSAGGTGGYDEKEEKEKQLNQYARAMTVISQSSVSSVLDTVFSYFTPQDKLDVQKWTQTERGKAFDAHREAADKLYVPKQNVILNKYGQPMTRAELAQHGNGNKECLTANPAEDLIRDADGSFRMDAGGWNYMHKDALSEQDKALDQADRMESIDEGLANGTLQLTDLNEEDKIAYLADKTPEERQALYQRTGLGDDAKTYIAELEHNIKAYQMDNAPGVLGDLIKSQPIVTINDGAVIGGSLSQAYTDAALGMKSLGQIYGNFPMSTPGLALKDPEPAPSM